MRKKEEPVLPTFLTALLEKLKKFGTFEWISEENDRKILHIEKVG